MIEPNEPTLRLMILRSLAGGGAAALVLFAAMRMASPTPPPPAHPQAETKPTPARSEPEFWVNGQPVVSSETFAARAPRPREDVVRDIYTEYGKEMRDAQRRRLEEEIQHGEDIDEATLERLSLPRHDNEMVLRKMQDEGVVMW